MKNPILEASDKKIDSSIIIKANKITVRTSELSWSKLDPELWFPVGDEIAYLQKSDSPRSGFKTIYEIHRNSPSVFIDTNSLTTLYRTDIMYFRIISSDKKLLSKVFSSEKIANLYGSEIIRRHEIQLKEGHSGNPLYLFIKNRTGDRCPECWDNIRGVRTKANCKTCLNTGYVQGFHDPICIYASLSPESVSVEQSATDTEVPAKVQGWTVAYPRINLGDVLVDPNTQDVWEVASVNITTHKRTPTKQELILDRRNEDLEIMQLISRIPRERYQEDMRHAEEKY